MQRLVSENIYEEVNITDYQGVCYKTINEGNPANILQTVCMLFAEKIVVIFLARAEWKIFPFLLSQPFLYIIKLIKWTVKLVAWAIIQTSLLPVDASDMGMDYDPGK